MTLQDLVSSLGNGGARPEDPFHADLFQKAVVLFWNNAADDHRDLGGFCFFAAR